MQSRQISPGHPLQETCCPVSSQLFLSLLPLGLGVLEQVASSATAATGRSGIIDFSTWGKREEGKIGLLEIHRRQKLSCTPSHGRHGNVLLQLHRHLLPPGSEIAVKHGCLIDKDRLLIGAKGCVCMCVYFYYNNIYVAVL